jgi:TRAP-type mannitol/chloroaromatic compound transport system substrate-binding protein
MAGGEIYQALERGVIDGAEFSTPNVDFSGGFHQVTKFWATPGWHQSASVFGVMINKASWDALSPETQDDLKIAAQANLIWSLSFTEKRATEAYQQFVDAGIKITRYDDETLASVQELANEVIVETACENPASAKVYLSQLEYLADYAKWRDASAPFNLGRTPNGPDIEAIRACAE